MGKVMKESTPRDICELADEIYYKPFTICGDINDEIDCKDSNIDCDDCVKIVKREKELTLDILNRAMINYNLSEGRYLIQDYPGMNYLVFRDRKFGKVFGRWKYTTIKEYETALKDALIYCIEHKT